MELGNIVKPWDLFRRVVTFSRPPRAEECSNTFYIAAKNDSLAATPISCIPSILVLFCRNRVCVLVLSRGEWGGVMAGLGIRSGLWAGYLAKTVAGICGCLERMTRL